MEIIGIRFCASVAIPTPLYCLVAWTGAIFAQTPSPAASGSAQKSPEGFTTGWGFGTKFEGSSSGDGMVMDVATGVGYNFTSHFGVDLGAHYYSSALRLSSSRRIQTQFPVMALAVPLKVTSLVQRTIESRNFRGR